jgi:HK97 family phage portal protein
MALLDYFKKKSEPVYRLSEQHERAVAQRQKDFSLSGLFGNSSGAAGFIQSYNNTGQVVSEFTSLTSATVYACVKLISETISKLPMKIVGPNHKIIDDSPLLALFEHPNEIQGYIEFMQFIITTLELTGNSVTYIDRDENGDPVRLIPIHPSNLAWSYTADTGLPYYSLFHPLIKTRSQVPVYDVIHLKNIPTGWGYAGLSTIAAAQNVIGINLAQNKVVANFYSQSPISSCLVNVEPNVSEEALSQMQASFKHRYTGSDSAGEALFVPSGFEVTPITMNYKDSQLLESREFSVTEIARIFGVPLSKLAFGDAKEVSNYEQENLAFVEDCIVHRCKKITEQFTYKLKNHLPIRDRNFNIQFDFTELNKTDTKTRFETYQIGLLNGIYCRSEVRDKEGLPPITNDPTADEYIVSSSVDGKPDLPGSQVNPKGGQNNNADAVGGQ